MIVKPVPVMEDCPKLTVAVPVFVIVTLCVAVLLTPMFPKASVATLPDSTPALPVLVLAPVEPTQPDNPPIAAITARKAIRANGLQPLLTRKRAPRAWS